MIINQKKNSAIKLSFLFSILLDHQILRHAHLHPLVVFQALDFLVEWVLVAQLSLKDANLYLIAK